MTDPTGPTEIVSLEETIAHLTLDDDTDLDEDKLQGFIDAATTYIQGKTGPIIPVQFVEVHNGGGPTIVLRNAPVLQVDEVIEYVGPVPYTLTAAELGINPGQYTYSLDNPAQGILARRYSGWQVGAFSPGKRNVKVTYWGGRATVPADIRMAVLQDIAGLYQSSQLGSNPYGAWGEAGNGPLNPMSIFPRVAAILDTPAMRGPAIA